MSRKLTYEHVKKVFKDNNCELLSEEYIDNLSKLSYVAQCGHHHFTSLNSFKCGKGNLCPKCARKESVSKRRLSYRYVKSYFKENGCILLSKDYVNVGSKIKYVAQCGHEHFISLSSFKLGQGRICHKCVRKDVSKKQRLSYKDVKNYFKKSGCKLLSENYINAHIKMEYIAKCGHEHSITLSDFKCGKGKMCPKCAFPKGENNHNWNSNLTSKDRASSRKTTSNSIWRKNVYERDNYTCQITGKIGCRLVAHHMKPYYKYKDLRFDVSNGITLDKEFHKFCHDIFGYKAEIGYGKLIEAQYLWNHREEV